MSISIRPVYTKKDFRQFIHLPWLIYRDDPLWVPPLILDVKETLSIKKNPFFKHSEIKLFLAKKGKQPVGRIAAIVDHNYISFQEEKTGFFGFFESINDEKVSEALFEAAEDWIKGNKMEKMLGPANPSTNEVLGTQIEGFSEPPFVLMPYNPPYYAELIEKTGLRKSKDLYAYMIDDSIPPTDKIKRVTEMIKKRHNITIRSFDMKNYKRDAELVKTVYNDAWERNWGFVPWTDEEIEHLTKQLKTIANPNLVIFAFVDDEIAGFSIALPDINQALKRMNGRLLPFGIFKLLWYSRKINQIRVVAMGMRQKYRQMGIDALFYYETHVRGRKDGNVRAELSWVLEDNFTMRNVAERWGLTPYKTYRVYEKEL